MVKTIRNALLFAAAVHILYVIVQVVSGMLLTMRYVPKIVDAYSSKQALESQVTFGLTASPSGWLYVLTFAGTAVLYAFALQLVVAEMGQSTEPAVASRAALTIGSMEDTPVSYK